MTLGDDDYDKFVGLLLNVPRLRFVQAGMTLAGVAAASHNEPLEEIWFDALAGFAEEVPELMDSVNRERVTKKVLAGTRRGM